MSEQMSHAGYLHTLIREAQPGRFKVAIDWIDNGGGDGEGAWRIWLDGQAMADNADLEVAASYALEEFRTWES